MAWVDTTTKRTYSGTDSGGAGATDAGTISVSAGDFVIVGVVLSGGAAATVTVSDNLGNTWVNTDTVAANGTTVFAAVRWSTITNAGAMSIKVVGNGSNSYDLTAFIHIFQNPNASPASGSGVSNTGTVSPMDTTAVTPADNDVLVGAVASSGNVSRTITQNDAAGDSGWTLSNEQEAGTNCSGSMVFKIISGAPGTPRAAWTLNSGATWAARIRAFKPAVTSTSSADVTTFFRTRVRTKGAQKRRRPL